MGPGGRERGVRVIFCPQDWPAGVDLYKIKLDNQFSVKDIVLACATENLMQVHIHPGLGIENLSSIIYHREFVIEINLIPFHVGLWRFERIDRRLTREHFMLTKRPSAYKQYIQNDS